MSDSIASISLINGGFDTSTSNSDFVKNIVKTEIIFKPKNFNDLYYKIFSDSIIKENQKILGLLSDSEKIEITDDNIYKKNKDKIFIYLGCKSIINDAQTPNRKDITIDQKIIDSFIKIPVPSDQNLVVEQNEEITKLTKRISGEIGEVQNNLFNSFIGEFDENLNKKLSESLSGIVLNASNKNIEKVKNLRNSVKLFSNKFFQRANSCILKTKENTKEIKEVKKMLEKKRTQIIDYKVNEVENEDEDKDEDEKIFEFCDNSISVDETKPKFEVKNIKIKNNSKIKDYKSDILVWLKEEKSNEDLNFDQEEIKNEFPFVKDQNYPKLKEIDNLTLNLCIKEPKVQKYKIYISIKDKEVNKIISKKPLEITVSMTLDLNYSWTYLKKLEFFEILDNNDEIIKKIYSENGNLNIIKDWLTKEINNKKESIIKDLMVKFQEDFKSTIVGEDESKKREIILEKKLDEKQIKKWIEDNSAKSNIDKKAEETDKLLNDKKEEEIDNHKKDEKAEEIYNKLNEDLMVDGFCNKEEVIAFIIKNKYNIEIIRSWAEDQIFNH